MGWGSGFGEDKRSRPEGMRSRESWSLKGKDVAFDCSVFIRRIQVCAAVICLRWVFQFLIRDYEQSWRFIREERGGDTSV